MYAKIAVESRRIVRSLIKLLFPNHCAFCGIPLRDGLCVCDLCLKRIEIIEGVTCKRCGAPVEMESRVNVCLQCEDLSFEFRMNESLGVYTGMLRELIHLYKFRKRRLLYSLFSDFVIRFKGKYILKHEVFIPMPLTRTRYSERGFNQSYLIAKEISRKLPVTFFGDIIKRQGNSKPQSVIQSRNARLFNISDRFIVKNRWRKIIAGKNILLFDDVLTTGATASACASALYQEKALNVDVLTLGRALMEPGAVYF